MDSSAIRTPEWNADASTGSWQCRSFRGCEASGGLPITCLAVSLPYLLRRGVLRAEALF